MSLYGRKSAAPEAQTWTWTWTPGANLANFFALYNYHSLADANGDFTSTGAFSIATTLDGPIQVARFRSLIVNHALTASQRCRGLMPIADSLSMGASGSISMTGMGAAGSIKWAVSRDIFVPASITFTGKNTSLQQFLAWIRSTGYCIFDPTMYACPLPGMGDVTCDWATWTPYGSTLVSGCGAGAPATAGAAGANGGAGTNGPGGGGCGAGFTSCLPSPGGSARPWGGGPGSGGMDTATNVPASVVTDQYGGQAGNGYGGTGGGGAGNPPGAGAGTGAAGSAGTGGILSIFVRGPVSLAVGHALSANGMSGGNTTGGRGGGGSGGGKVGLYYSGTLTGSPSMTASGGPGGTGNIAGGYGGAGHCENRTFAVMGW